LATAAAAAAAASRLCTSLTVWQDNDVIRQADAYVVIYSMTDRSSYQWAYSFIDDVTQSRGGDDVKRPNLRSRRSMDVVVILVANKSDLVRKRQVSTEGKMLISKMRCTYCKGRHCRCMLPLTFVLLLRWWIVAA